LPGQWIKVWFNGSKIGTYELACAELCGTGHYNMRGQVFIDSQADYDKWLDEQYKISKPVLEAPVSSDTTIVASADTKDSKTTKN
jgi:cytochrome c oxidase subunit 2